MSNCIYCMHEIATGELEHKNEVKLKDTPSSAYKSYCGEVIKKENGVNILCGCEIPRNKKVLSIWLKEFEKDMLTKFADHDEKWQENSVIREGFDFRTIDIEWLRKEINYHYAKWLYRGVVRQDLDERDTLTNLTNMAFLLWIRLNIKEGVEK